jgi:hypothetical protein
VLVRSITVIEVITREGTGTNEDPFCEVTRYYSLEGNLLAEKFDRQKRH